MTGKNDLQSRNNVIDCPEYYQNQIKSGRNKSEEPRPTEAVAARRQYRGPYGQQSFIPQP